MDFLINACDFYSDFGKFIKALTISKDVINILNKDNEDRREANQKRVAIHLSVGVTYSQMGKYDCSEEEYKKALKIAKKYFSKNYAKNAEIYFNRAINNRRRKEFKKARKELIYSEKIIDNLGGDTWEHMKGKIEKERNLINEEMEGINWKEHCLLTKRFYRKEKKSEKISSRYEDDI